MALVIIISSIGMGGRPAFHAIGVETSSLRLRCVSQGVG